MLDEFASVLVELVFLPLSACGIPTPNVIQIPNVQEVVKGVVALEVMKGVVALEEGVGALDQAEDREVSDSFPDLQCVFEFLLVAHGTQYACNGDFHKQNIAYHYA